MIKPTHYHYENGIKFRCDGSLCWMKHKRLGRLWAAAARKRAGLKPIKYLTWRNAWADALMFGFSWHYCQDDGSRCFMLHCGRKVLIVGPHFSEENE